MNVHDEMSDSEVLRTAADVLSAIPVAGPPDAEAVMARGRARRRHHRATLGLASTTAAAAVAISLAAALGGSPASAPGVGTIQTTAFTLVQNANGTVTLTLTQGQMFDPSVLQRALARDGIPALVIAGCSLGVLAWVEHSRRLARLTVIYAVVALVIGGWLASVPDYVLMFWPALAPQPWHLTALDALLGPAAVLIAAGMAFRWRGRRPGRGRLPA